MSSFLYGLGRWAVRRRIAIGLTWLTVLAVVGGLAAVGAEEFDESFSLPGTESQTALDALSRTFPQASGTTAQVVVVAPAGASVRDPEIRAVIEQAADGYSGVDQVEQQPDLAQPLSLRTRSSTPGIAASTASSVP